MTKSELIKALEKYPDDAEVYIGTKGYDEALEIDAVEETFGDPTLVNNEEVRAYNVKNMAFEYYKNHPTTDDEYIAYTEWEKHL